MWKKNSKFAKKIMIVVLIVFVVRDVLAVSCVAFVVGVDVGAVVLLLCLFGCLFV